MYAVVCANRGRGRVLKGVDDAYGIRRVSEASDLSGFSPAEFGCLAAYRKVPARCVAAENQCDDPPDHVHLTKQTSLTMARVRTG